jgi:DNA-binding NarL/FixJ family response regulator
MTWDDQLRARREEPARLIIVDDHALVRAGLRAMLAGWDDLVVVGEAGDGAAALALCRQVRPDLVLMDIRLPILDGLATTKALKREFPAVSVIIVTLYEDPDYLFQAIKAGAVGYVLKDISQHQLVTAIRQALCQEFLLNPAVLDRLLGRWVSETPRLSPALAEQLTPREATVLRLLARGWTNREIAADLRVAVGTVKTHVEHIIAKLDVSGRTQAAVRGVELGLVAQAAD